MYNLSLVYQIQIHGMFSTKIICVSIQKVEILKVFKRMTYIYIVILSANCFQRLLPFVREQTDI